MLMMKGNEIFMSKGDDVASLTDVDGTLQAGDIEDELNGLNKP